MILDISLANERRRYIFQVVSHWLSPYLESSLSLIAEHSTCHHTCVSGQCGVLSWTCKPTDFRHTIGLSHKTSYHKINLEATKLDDKMIDDRIVFKFDKRFECMSNVREIAKIQIQSSNLRNFAKSYVWKSNIYGRPIYVGARHVSSDLKINQRKIHAVVLMTHQVQSCFEKS